MLPKQVQVVVVGAGPTGLALACTLRQSGVDVLVVDRAKEGTNTSRAAVVHARTLEVLEELDVSRRMIAEGLVVPVFTIRDRARTLARIDFSGLPTPYPYTVMLPQARTEALLTNRLAELGGQVHRQYTVMGVRSSAEGAELDISSPDGQRETVQTQYAVGADGMHSVVREAAAIGFTGGRYAQSFLLADVQLEWPLPANEVQLFFSGDGLVVVAPLPGGHHRVVATMDAAPEQVTVAAVQALLDRRGPGSAGVNSLAWGSRFEVHHRVADVYRRGALLLAGDAAHVHSPAGGQGMNTGVQDAVDLGRTLTGVLDNPQTGGALDAYQDRRRPVAQHVVMLTDRATRIATLTSPAARTARNLLISQIGRVPAIERLIARQLAELQVGAKRGSRRTGTARASEPDNAKPCT